MDTTSPQPEPLIALAADLRTQMRVAVDEQRRQAAKLSSATYLSSALVEELGSAAEIATCDLTVTEFGETLARVGDKFNYGQPTDATPNAAQQAAFLRNLRVADLALATACVLGREVAWRRFFDLYRAPLTKAAIAITHSSTLGEELADSLYAELYGLRSSEADSARRQPLASYSGRGSLLGWLRTTIAQRHVDHHRRTHRETPLGTLDLPAVQSEPVPAHLSYLKHAVTRVIQSLGPADRFLLSSYYIDQRKLSQIGRMLHLHEATISRRIKRLSHDLRDDLLRNLQIGGLSLQAAEEALCTDPRDLEINLRWLLQTAPTSPFIEENERDEYSARPSKSGQL